MANISIYAGLDGSNESARIEIEVKKQDIRHAVHHMGSRHRYLSKP